MRSPFLIISLLMGGDCGTTVCPPRVPPMTASRAAQIAPEVVTGLAVSTTHIFGDCRAPSATDPPVEPDVCGQVDDRCARERKPLRVLVIPVNQSVDIGTRCTPNAEVDGLADAAVGDARASADGELVLDLDPGQYTVFVTLDDRCAVCGLAQSAGACLITIDPGEVLARNLILDDSTR